MIVLFGGPDSPSDNSDHLFYLSSVIYSIKRGFAACADQQHVHARYNSVSFHKRAKNPADSHALGEASDGKERPPPPPPRRPLPPIRSNITSYWQNSRTMQKCGRKTTYFVYFLRFLWQKIAILQKTFPPSVSICSCFLPPPPPPVLFLHTRTHARTHARTRTHSMTEQTTPKMTPEKKCVCVCVCEREREANGGGITKQLFQFRSFALPESPSCSGWRNTIIWQYCC